MSQQPRLHHVSVPRPYGSDAQVRAFYGQLIGLEELPIPDSLRNEGLIWYRLGSSELHLFSEEPRADTSGRHFCIALADVESLRPRLTGAGYEITETIPIPGRPRFFCHDPFGNMIEFTTVIQA